MVGVRMREEEFIIKFYSCDDEEQFLKDIYHNLNCLQQENQQLKATLEIYENGVYFSSENDKLKEENQQLKEQLLVVQTNEETFRLEMEDITKILGLDEYTIFDDVKVYARSLKDNWNELKEYAKEIISTDNELYGTDLLDKMQELEQGSDSK